MDKGVLADHMQEMGLAAEPVTPDMSRGRSGDDRKRKREGSATPGAEGRSGSRGGGLFAGLFYNVFFFGQFACLLTLRVSSPFPVLQDCRRQHRWSRCRS